MLKARVLLITSDQALGSSLKSELLEEGFDVYISDQLPGAVSLPTVEENGGHFQVVLVEQAAIEGWNRALYDLLIIKHQGPASILLAPSRSHVMTGSWFRVIFPPFDFQELVSCVREAYSQKLKADYFDNDLDDAAQAANF